MTTAEFKQTYPGHAHLEGDELWDAMTATQMRAQKGNAVLQKSKPFWKRYQLRWLFYRKSTRPAFGHSGPRYTIETMCSKCRLGVSSCLALLSPEDLVKHCPRCGPGLVKVPNTNFGHRLWLVWRAIKYAMFWLLDFLHIMRWRGSRYDMFTGDESMFVHHESYNIETWENKRYFKPRKWWQYIIIPKNPPFHT